MYRKLAAVAWRRRIHHESPTIVAVHAPSLGGMASTKADQLEALVLTLWRRRGEAAAVAETTSQLQSMLKDPAALDAVEFYLPQFAHMLIQLGGAPGR